MVNSHILSGMVLALSGKTKPMRAFLFILLICPIVMFAQRDQQAQPVNGSTDCPNFSKKNVTSKAGFFQAMRTHKTLPVQNTRQQQPVYRSSALPNLEQAQQERNAEVKKNDRISAKTQRQQKNKPVVTEDPSEAETRIAKSEPVVTPEIAEATPVRKSSKPENRSKKQTPEEVVNDRKDNNDKDAVLKEEVVSAEAAAGKSDEAREKRDKNLKKAAFRSKIQHLFKRTNKPVSKKHVEKCPSF